MWNFEFSTYGTAVLIALLLASGLAVWVFGANIRHRYIEASTGIGEDAVKIAKNENQVLKDFSFGTAPRTMFYWVFNYRKNKKQILFPFNAFLSDSVYHVANTLNELIYIKEVTEKKKTWFLVVENALLFILFFCALNISWSLIASMWGVAIIFAGLMVAFFLIEMLMCQKLALKTAKETKNIMLTLSKNEAKLEVTKYCKYLRLRVAKKYLLCFLQGYIDLIIMIWRIGRDNER